MRNQKGFTLVELLVTMAIIAVILGMTVFGISLAQRAQRDAQRRDAIDDINLGMQSYYEIYSEYPEGNDVDFQADAVVLSRNGEEFLTIELEGITSQIGFNLSGTDTTANGTKYCYERTDTGFVLGAMLENSAWFEAGSDLDSTCEELYGN